MRKVDLLDKKIISLLQENGRMTFIKIAETLGVAEGTVRKKVNSLIKDEVINITAVCNPFIVSYNSPAFIGLDVERSKIKSVAQQLSDFHEVQFVAVTTGPFDLIIQVFAQSNENLYDFILNKLTLLDGIIDTQTLLIMNISKQVGKIEFGFSEEGSEN
ncbi:MAG: Lrp/AsnC family transcriptional regulator [Dethiobacter sp.]|jgi:Lrp/AsnC family transcriptional regulator for asnA, asnC and gidA|nr:Lrp/AsnC family transcriptional regulator [Dethiobacter sp.]